MRRTGLEVGLVVVVGLDVGCPGPVVAVGAFVAGEPDLRGYFNPVAAQEPFLGVS